MEGNPFAELAEMLPEQQGKKSGSNTGKLIMRMGTVLTVTPLTVDVGGITASGNELRVNSAMLEHTETVVPSGETPPGFEASVTPVLSVGDTVLVLTEDDQLFYISCKVVSV